MIGDGVAGKAQVLGRQPLQKALGVAQIPEKVVVGQHGARSRRVSVGQHAHGDAGKPERRPHQRPESVRLRNGFPHSEQARNSRHRQHPHQRVQARGRGNSRDNGPQPQPEPVSYTHLQRGLAQGLADVQILGQLQHEAAVFVAEQKLFGHGRVGLEAQPVAQGHFADLSLIHILPI